MLLTAPSTGIAMCQVSESIDEPLMSSFVYERTFSRPKSMSALPPKADVVGGSVPLSGLGGKIIGPATEDIGNQDRPSEQRSR